MPNVFLFHRDLRLHDHRPLQQCLSQETIPVFVLDPFQVSTGVKIMSIKSIACLFQSLVELDVELWERFQARLCIKQGSYPSILSELNKAHGITHVFETKDYTPYARKREAEIRKWCDRNGVGFTSVDDLYFFPPGTILNQSGKVYQKFTPFYNKASRLTIPRPLRVVRGKFRTEPTSSPVSKILERVWKQLGSASSTWKMETRLHQGGRSEGLRLLKHLKQNYQITSLYRSGLSVHHHYGTISVRESYHASLSISDPSMEEFRRQLFWREFYGNLICYFKELYGSDPLEYQKPNIKSLDQDKKKLLKKWCQGKTGVKVVDAAMNQLNTEGFIPNRLRLLCASWLIKDAGVPWRWGERYFANHLLDYDFTQNMLNWLWVAGGLPFAMAPFRRFNPELPSTKDNLAYLERWSRSEIGIETKGPSE